jgi:tight adherence protein B
MQALIYVLAFVAVVLVIQLLLSTVLARRDRDKRVNRRLTMLAGGMKPDEVYQTLVRRPVGGDESRRVADLHERTWNWLQQAGLSITPVRLLLSVLGAASVLWLVGLLVLSAQGAGGLLLNGVMALVGAVTLSTLGAYVWVSGRRTARLKKIEQQLPLALDIVNRAIRAGHPVISAVQLAANEMGDPIGSEFGLIVDETTYGAEFRDALVSFARRTGSRDAHFFAVSVGIQSETGGNLAEILAGLAGVIRGRGTLAMRVNALASEGLASAMILSALPVLLIGSMALFQPRFYTDHFSDPVFWPAAACILGLYLLGQLLIRNIINIKY